MKFFCELFCDESSMSRLFKAHRSNYFRGDQVMFRKTPISACVALLCAAGASFVSAQAIAQGTVEVTGSRIKRVDAEGAVPVTVITREQIESSGVTSVAEVMRNVTFAAAGNFRPQSGSSAQAWASIDLKGLGSGRTLVLIDGRRAPKGPMVATAADMNSIPLGAVERIEILTDGASAVYGSDAIAGVVNIITRKDFEGFQYSFGYTNPSNPGGERREGSVLFGTSGKDGRVLAGISYNERGMVYTRDRVWGTDKGVSSYGNNYVTSKGLIAVPGACTDKDFWLTSSNTCSFDFNSRAADEAQIKNASLFARGEYKVNKDWSLYANTGVTRVESFGRYAPTPGAVVLSATSPNNIASQVDPSLAGKSVTLRHRFAAAGNRDTNTDSNIYDMLLGTQGQIGSVAIDAGFRWTDYQYLELGRNYIVTAIATQFMNSGAYNIFKPSANSADVLNSIKATIGRDSNFKIAEVYGTATVPLMKMAGGQVQLLLGGERRFEQYQDQYDSLSEGGQILGSAGNSAGGTRGVTSMFSEALLPVASGVEVSLAARHENYSDYGSSNAPKASLRWKLSNNLLLRGSVGAGFAAPSLDKITQKESFSAESVIDPRTYIAFGGAASQASTRQVQVDTYYIANPKLAAEKSKNLSLGFVWDVVPQLSIKADVWKIDVSDKIAQITAQGIINRSNGTDPRAIPAGLGVTRNAVTGAIERIQAGYGNEGEIGLRGVDLTATARYKLLGKDIDQRLTWSRMNSYVDDGDELAGTAGLPKDRVVLSTKIPVMPKMDFFWYANYIGPHGDAEAGTRYSGHTSQDVQLIWDTPIKGGRVSVGVVNLTGWYPCKDGIGSANCIPYDGRNFNFYLYDSYGRQPYVRFTQRF
ncbi:MAG: TonB-dependent receptor [Betaproteobacteria bacterium]|nr:TonB-dependent receptor [Betaproteobacteria bacterium]NBO44353.1 TonB-dependent receptor [Betaproteobacteria bacterium]NBU00789.1 TonB-dependent receptor [Betaproteobacteria bacterium]NBU66185.1 TonB-dependent receptor [Betaproteobacteria bacterium]NCU97737.1 TonB-dependent receptor [Betaproteobacteria bacterium]